MTPTEPSGGRVDKRRISLNTALKPLCAICGGQKNIIRGACDRLTLPSNQLSINALHAYCSYSYPLRISQGSFLFTKRKPLLFCAKKMPLVWAVKPDLAMPQQGLSPLFDRMEGDFPSPKNPEGIERIELFINLMKNLVDCIVFCFHSILFLCF